ncbi:GerAB/ArcD/ProY family transporter [Paenibacillus typhae]|uniref:GerAB/ArcD/ProY family transporter n=1 Tax=Paenibacillus typhae TaxID=1174501 RepID=UPI001C8F0754|nr:endospore germination permease [Paenibacillus typhae]MBY0011226.1 endospore germination permease [Paenibacillus typhae]
MLEKGKISGFQMALMLYPTVLATGFLTLPTISAQFAGNDLWMTGILSSFMGIITVLVVVRLHEIYPNETIVQQTEHIIGVLPSKLLGILLSIYVVRANGLIIRQYTDFVTGNFLFKTPSLFVTSSMVLLTCITVRGGLELMARCTVIFTPLFMFPLLFLLLLFPDLDINNILPILGRGFIPVLQGSATPLAWISELFLMTFFLPNLTKPEQGRKWGMISLYLIVLSMTFVNLITLFLLGPDISNKIYPVLIAFRYISLANFFENLESLLLAMWVVGNFVKICVFLYAAVFSFTQTLKLSDYRPFVFSFGILTILFSLWDLPNFSALGAVLTYVTPFEIPLVFTLMPLILLIISRLRSM